MYQIDHCFEASLNAKGENNDFKMCIRDRDKGQALMRVDKYLFERIVNASRNRIQNAAADGFVMVN